jgi:hypothetical protein
MIGSLSIFLATLTLMGVVAWRANATLPPGKLPMGRTNKPNANRIIVVLQIPIIYFSTLAFIIITSNIDASASRLRSLPTFALACISIVMLVAQQAQLWGVRRLMRKHLY